MRIDLKHFPLGNFDGHKIYLFVGHMRNIHTKVQFDQTCGLGVEYLFYLRHTESIISPSSHDEFQPISKQPSKEESLYKMKFGLNHFSKFIMEIPFKNIYHYKRSAINP